jgi:hypothetical protein
MNYEIIPQEIRGIINNQYPQINDENKKQLAELWRILLQIGHVEQAMPQFLAFLQTQIEDVNDSQTISDRIDAEIASMEGLTGGKRKRKSSKKSFRNSSKKRKGKSSKKRKGKYSKKSSKNRK